MENKHDPIFDRVITACKASYEHGDTRKLYWMIKSQWYKMSYAQFARLFGFGRKDASRPRIHLALKLEA
jgi:hypothetical protein